MPMHVLIRFVVLSTSTRRNSWRSKTNWKQLECRACRQTPRTRSWRTSSWQTRYATTSTRKAVSPISACNLWCRKNNRNQKKQPAFTRQTPGDLQWKEVPGQPKESQSWKGGLQVTQLHKQEERSRTYRPRKQTYPRPHNKRETELIDADEEAEQGLLPQPHSEETHAAEQWRSQHRRNDWSVAQTQGKRLDNSAEDISAHVVKFRQFENATNHPQKQRSFIIYPFANSEQHPRVLVLRSKLWWRFESSKKYLRHYREGVVSEFIRREDQNFPNSR